MLPFAPADPVIGLIARITPFKQQDLFIRAIPHVLAHKPNSKFVIIGSAAHEDEDYAKKLTKLQQKLGLDETLKFLGLRSDSIELTTELAISILPSTREPLGRVILEAGLLGIPVITANTGGPAEIVINGETGFTFDALNENAHILLAEKIITMLENENLQKKFTSNAKQRIQDKFASFAPIKIQQDLIKRIIDEHRSKQIQ